MAEQEFMGGPSGVREEAKKEVKKVLARAADPAEKKAGKEETDLFEDFEEEEPVPAGKPGKKVPAINPVEDEAYLQAMEEPLDIIPRERRLNEEEVRLFTYFVKVPGMKEQLIDT